MKTNDVRRQAPPVDAASNSRVERKSGDFLLLASTLAMIGWCVPLAIAFPHRPRGSPFGTWDLIWHALALLLPIVVTCGAVYQAVTWIVRKGATRRRRMVWRVLLTVAFLGSAPGYILATIVAVAVGLGKSGIR
jgi:hypothetical protein